MLRSGRLFQPDLMTFTLKYPASLLHKGGDIASSHVEVKIGVLENGVAGAADGAKVPRLCAGSEAKMVLGSAAGGGHTDR
jgi:hypothetical protein